MTQYQLKGEDFDPHTEQFNCANISGHTVCPPGYEQWHEWARQKTRTHRQVRCPDCRLFLIWIERKSPRWTVKADAEPEHGHGTGNVRHPDLCDECLALEGEMR